MNNKLDVVILFGGTSSEHDISLRSASHVIDLLSERVNMILIGITKQGNWMHYQGTTSDIENDLWCTHDCTPVVVRPGTSGGLFELSQGELIKISVDVVFPVLHGQGGEDGTTQGLLETCRLPYVGCKVLSSALCMDKDASHRLAAAANIHCPHSEVVYKNDAPERIASVVKSCGYPLFVKPARGGSSYGVSKVENENELDEALACAFSYDDKVAIEEAIQGVEVGCAITGSIQGELHMGVVDETVVSDDGFFHIHQDHTKGSDTTTHNSSVCCPAHLSPEQMEAVRQTGFKVYKALGCDGLARVDLFVTPEGDVVFNEVNTLPGLTTYSRFPAMIEASGNNLTDVLLDILTKAAHLTNASHLSDVAHLSDGTYQEE